MGQLVEVARTLRETHDFRGYIHLKTIPDADGDLLADAGRYADRLSINVELPTHSALRDLAPEKDHRTIKLSMARIRRRRDEAREAAKERRRASSLAPRRPRAPAFAPAGQSTQMIIGAEPSNDAQILSMSSNLYASYSLSRVYYSAFSPIPDASTQLPVRRAPLLREHRLYQSDWLMRFYGFDHDEIVDTGQAKGMLDLDIDPKLAWALRHRAFFPVDINRCGRARLLRVPGLGTRSVQRILKMRRHRRLRLDDLATLRAAVKRAMPFIVCADHTPGLGDVASERLRATFTAPAQQLSLAL